MAFIKYASATVTQPYVTPKTWGKIRTASSDKNIPASIVDQANTILGGEFNPDQYLLTHATIVASVDTYEPANAKLGSVEDNGFTVNRKYGNYRIKPECDKFINNNLDSWDRDVLLQSYRTFVGSHNFVEHVQVEDLSKGRIIDAVARDIGDSVYIDILVATDRKHTDLVKAIESGQMNSMSMGCFLPNTQVTVSDGTRVSISDIQVGDMVLTHKGRMQPVKNKQILTGTWDMITVSARGLPSEITSTANHPYFVYRPKQECACGCGEKLDSVNASDPTRRMNTRFKRGHKLRVLNPNGVYSLEEYRNKVALLEDINSWDLEEVRADELQVGDYVCFPRVKEDSDTITDVEIASARLLGYFLAEGSFLKRKGAIKGVEFCFSLEEKSTYAQEVFDLLVELYPNENTPCIYDREDRNTCTVRINSETVALWFKEHGGEYSNKKKLSATVMDWNTTAQKHLIGAWINGDGHLHNIHKTTGVVTTSYDLACQMQVLFNRCGFFANMSCKIHSKSVSLKQIVNGGFERDIESGRLPSYSLTVGRMQTYGLSEYCDKVSPSDSHNLHLQVREDYIVCPITEIESGRYDGTVYDLEIEEDHSYVVEGVSVHNCTVDFTQCTKCGNVAVDETEMCKHIRYEKGNTFFDEKGQQHRVAELCGHKTVDGGGVTFIEASWVATPAFTGAVMRNIISPTEEISKKAEQILSVPPAEWGEDQLSKVAKSRHAFDFGGDDDDEDGGGDDSDPFQEFSDDIEKAVLNKIKRKIRQKINEDDESAKKNPTPSPEESTAEPNDNVIKQGSNREYLANVRTIVAHSTSSADLINSLAEYNNLVGLSISKSIYRIALSLGSLSNYSNSDQYIKCGSKLNGSAFSQKEKNILIKLGTLLSLRK